MKSGLLLFVACLLLLLGGCTGDPPTVWLELTPIGRLSHQVYADVILTFHNDSNEKIAIYRSSHNGTVAASMDNFLSFEIESDDGTDLTFKRGREVWELPQAEDRVVIEPGERFAEKINLARFYVEPEKVSEEIAQPW
ncbi:MAG: hypothetical protein GY867_11305, partial [bacterium]|nr:hypothetical protein [bacterium]